MQPLARTLAARRAMGITKCGSGCIAQRSPSRFLSRGSSCLHGNRMAAVAQAAWTRQCRPLCTSAAKPVVVFNAALVEYLEAKRRRYKEVEEMLSAPEVPVSQLSTLGKEMSDLSSLVQLAEKRDDLVNNIAELRSVEKEERAKGPEGEELASMAESERLELEAELASVENAAVRLLIPKDKDDDRNTIIEVRAGTGGDEASLFAGELFKMYQKFSTTVMGWKWEELSLSRTDIGGFKEAQAQISGSSVHKYFKFEAGVHRVQRIPVNDTKIQTSAASVIVMPEAEDVDVDLRPGDIRIDVFRSSGAGGQSVNKTESAVRMTHIPTGIVVSMQDERSQIQNRARAMKVLRAKVYDLERQRHMQALSDLRSASNGTGDRSDKIRTYNFPHDRVTDHRAGFSVNSMEKMMNGELLATIVDKLVEADEAEKIRKLVDELNGNTW